MQEHLVERGAAQRHVLRLDPGLLKGSYESGHYQARWIDRAGDHGVAGGVYFPGPAMRAGGFLGRWAETSCAAGN